MGVIRRQTGNPYERIGWWPPGWSRVSPSLIFPPLASEKKSNIILAQPSQLGVSGTWTSEWGLQWTFKWHCPLGSSTFSFHWFSRCKFFGCYFWPTIASLMFLVRGPWFMLYNSIHSNEIVSHCLLPPIFAFCRNSACKGWVTFSSVSELLVIFNAVVEIVCWVRWFIP